MSDTAGMEQVKKIVPDAEVEDAFAGTNFGINTMEARRKLLAHGVLSRAAGYHTGHTLTGVMCRLGLITAKNNVTKKGHRYASWSFYDQKHSG